MSELRRTGTTIMNLPSVGETRERGDELLDAVREMAAGDYEVFGEIGRGDDSTIAYLARDIAAFKLVALKLTPSQTDPDEFLLDVVDELDSTLPSFDNPCHKCGTRLYKWGRFCPNCGTDLYDKAEQKWTADELREAVQEFATDSFEILGEMRTQGGGRIYFARDFVTQKVEVLRLQRTSEDEFSLGFTGVLKPVIASVVGKDRPSLSMTTPRAQSGQRTVEPREPAPPAPRKPKESLVRDEPSFTQPVQLQASEKESVKPPRRKQASTDEDPWAPLRDFVQQPIVLTVLLVCLVLVLLIILALVT